MLRGGSEQFIEESHRSIHDALMIVKVRTNPGHWTIPSPPIIPKVLK